MNELCVCPYPSRFLAGLLGVGGGTVTVPALTMGLDMTHYQVGVLSVSWAAVMTGDE